MKRADVTEAADVLTRMLAAIDSGELDATAAERNALSGALIALQEMGKPPARRAPEPPALDPTRTYGRGYAHGYSPPPDEARPEGDTPPS